LKASSFKKGKKLYIDTWKLLPLSRFLPQPPIAKKGGGKGKGKDRRIGRGLSEEDRGLDWSQDQR
jgi:H/ACA ribonucleoprotein complex subunit 1